MFFNASLVMQDTATVTFTPFSPGYYYVYVAFSDDFLDATSPGTGGFIDLLSYYVLDVDTTSMNQSVDTDYNLECNGGRFCSSLQRVCKSMQRHD